MNEENSIVSKDDLKEQIMAGETPIKDLTHIFNEYQIKESMLRTQHLSELQNKVIEKIDDRITKKADNFTNTELLNALNVIQSTQEKNTSYVNTLNEKPQVQFVSNTMNVTVQEEFDQSSRDKIVNAVSELLKLAQQKEQQIETSQMIEIIPEEKETE